MAARVFEVAGGRLRGELVADGAVVRLLGVPYGASVRGSARFIPAAPVMPWAGVRDCLTIGPAAPQPAMVFGVGERGRELAALCAGFTCTEAQDEDCLVLNIWAPAGGGAARPVLVSFHGGAYTVGSSSMPVYDGAWLAEHEDLVVVTVNHRLGALGCLELGELLGERYRSSGAVGQQDLVLALQWVRENIAAFGGDSSRVTIAGVSGGGWKVCHLLAMPQAAGLFHGAIVQSGPRLRALPRDRAAAITHTLLDELGLGATEARRLLDVPADRLVAAQVAATGSPLGDLAAGGRHFAPVLDGEVVPSDPFVPEAPVGSASVPLLIGTTRDELTFFTYGNPALDGLDDAGAAKMARRMSGSDTLYDCYRRTRPSVSAKERLVS
ncbi:MAG: carboxylesterase family protein, partial [Acidimicrobiia bacterium]